MNCQTSKTIPASAATINTRVFVVNGNGAAAYNVTLTGTPTILPITPPVETNLKLYRQNGPTRTPTGYRQRLNRSIPPPKPLQPPGKTRVYPGFSAYSRSAVLRCYAQRRFGRGFVCAEQRCRNLTTAFVKPGSTRRLISANHRCIFGKGPVGIRCADAAHRVGRFGQRR